MNKQFEEIISEANRVALTSKEKSRSRDFLLTFMGKHKKESPLKRIWNFMPLRFLFKPVYAVILVLLLGGGGTVFAAEASLPDDTLYPVKIYINEPVRGAFAFSEEKKADFEAWRAERRLTEMKKLEEKGQLTDEKKSRIEENFKRHEENINAVIQKLEEKNNPNAAKLRVRLQNSIKAHEEILQKFEEGRKSPMDKPHAAKPDAAETGDELNTSAKPFADDTNINKQPQDNTSHNKPEQAGPKNK
ncbi:hypothetical protein HZA39_00470 [Candidatus Peregrinibacteria bacterium]|nr:hypothetical protein [Candidatus Peregrinibacteria bacterium]